MPTPDFVTGDDPLEGLNEQAPDAPYVPSTPWDIVSSQALDTTERVVDWVRDHAATQGYPDLDTEVDAYTPPEPNVAPDILKKEFPGVTGIDQAMPATVAETMAAQQRRDARRAEIMARYPGGLGNALLGPGIGVDSPVGTLQIPGAAGLVAGLLDPVGDAAFMVPVVGEARYAEWLARAGEVAGTAGRLGVTAGVGAARGAAGGAILGAGRAALGDPDETLGSIASESLNLGILGGILHTAGAYRGDVLGERFLTSDEGRAAAADASLHDDAVRVAAAQMADGQPVEVRPLFDVARRTRADLFGTTAVDRVPQNYLDQAVERAAGRPSDEDIRLQDMATEAKATPPDRVMSDRMADAEQDIEALKAEGVLTPEDEAALAQFEPTQQETAHDAPGAPRAADEAVAQPKAEEAATESPAGAARPLPVGGANPEAEAALAPPSVTGAEKLGQQPTGYPVADQVKEALERGETINGSRLQQMAGSSLARGEIGRDDLYDQAELGMNRYVRAHAEDFDTTAPEPAAEQTANRLEALKDRLPTQTVRAGEKDALQQFSTPPDYAYAAAWSAGLKPDDVVLEPSAGTGSLVAHALNGPRKVHVNDLSDRRAGMLRSLEPASVRQENAEHLHAILPPEVKPSVVLMNPPFSVSAARNMKSGDIGAKHLESALRKLEPGGRLVAIVGRGMTPDAPAFRAFWSRVGSEYAIRANVGVDGAIYRKYGTTFPTRLVVIDKVSPDGRPVLTADGVKTAADVIRTLSDVRDLRATGTPVEPHGTEPAGAELAEGGQGAGGPVEPLPESTGVVGPPAGGEVPGQRDRAGGSGEPGQSDGGLRPDEGADRQHLRLADDQSERPGGSVGTGGHAGESPDGSAGPLGSGGGGAGDGIRPDGGGERVVPGVTPAPLTVRVTEASLEPDLHDAPLTDALYEPYKPRRVAISGAKPHPGPLVQSAAMATVDPPAPTHSLALPSGVIDDGLLSDAQLEAVVYAGQAHGEMLPAGEGEIPRRRGFFIGDGTGVGKGREVAGIILDNWARGSMKHVWVSEKRPLINDARRDWSGLGGDPAQVIEHGATKPKDAISAKEGVLFTTYDTLKSGEKGEGGKSRLQQIADWVGKDFDGVIAYDEAHNMGNLAETKGARGVKKAAAKAIAANELQQQLPNARVVYVSATGATEVENLAYADRLGLWGRGTPFASRDDFVAKIGRGGVAAMELVSRDMKALGAYIARNLSYDGVEYDRLEHTLTPDQRGTYDKLAGAWQVVLQNFESAMETAGITETNRAGGTKTLNANARSQILSQFWGGHQRFFNQIITSMQMPTVLKGVERDIAEGRQAVLQLVNTNEAAQERGLEKFRASGAGGEGLEDLDMTPRDQLMQLVQGAYPTMIHEEYVDENGNRRSRPAADRNGDPVHDPALVARRDALLDELGAIRVPEGPLEMLMNHFGAERVAEVTGRKQRVVKDENGRTVVEKRSAQANVAEASLFQQGTKPVLVFSEAGGTGRSYHADIDSGSADMRRSHYLVQAGWRADKAVQGFGRTHRTNQASAPIFHLVTTDLQGQKRFVSSIARRLGQLGALTKGERKAGDQGLFGLRDNLESDEAKAALRSLYDDVVAGKVEGLSVAELQDKMGLKLVDPATGRIMQDPPPMTSFLNRLLSLKVDDQNRVFGEFSRRLDDVIDQAAAAGTLDSGVENFKADKLRKVAEQTVYTDPRSGAQTKHVHMEALTRNQPSDFETVSERAKALNRGGPPTFVRSERSGRVFAVADAQSRTDERGAIIDRKRLIGPLDYQFTEAHRLDDWRNWKQLGPDEAKDAWAQQVARLPEYAKQDLNVITGAVLPIWDRLGGTPRVLRFQTDEGERMLGRVIPNDSVEATLQALGAKASKVTATPKEIGDRVLAGETARLANGWRIKRSMVAGEPRLELVGPDHAYMGQLAQDGVFTERIDWQTRFFIPTGEKGEAVIKRVIESRPVMSLSGPGPEMRAQVISRPANDVRPLSRAERLPTDRYIVFNTHKGSGAEGIFPSEEDARAFVESHPEGHLFDWASQRDLERWNPTGPENPEYDMFMLRRRIEDALRDRSDEVAPGLRARPLGETSPVEQRLVERVADIVRTMAPGADVVGARRLESVGDFRDMAGHVEGAQLAGATYASGAKGLIAWSLESPDAEATAKHEVVHYLKHGGFIRPEEWSALEDAAKANGWEEHFDIAQRYPNANPEVRLEEAIADAHGQWIKAPDWVPEAVRPIFERLQQLLDQVKDYVHRAFGQDVTAGDVFSRISSGEVGRRMPMTGDVGEFAAAQALNPDQMEAAAEAKRKLTLQQDIIKRHALARKVGDIRAAGLSLAHGFDALTRGISEAVPGGRDSTAQQQLARQNEFTGRLVANLEKIPGGLEAWRKRLVTADWVRELHELNKQQGGQPGITKNPLALKIAHAVHDAQDLARFQMNRAGAWVGDYDGYVARTQHDAIRIHNAGFEQWAGDILGALDSEKTFGDIPAGERETYLRDTWDALSTGIHLSSIHGIGTKAAAFPGAGNVARRDSASRVLHFKDADAWRQYQEKYGDANIEHGVLSGLVRAGRDTALMERWGSNPKLAFENLVQQVRATHRSDHEAIRKLDATLPRLREEFAYLSGEAQRPGTDLASKIKGSAIALQDIAKLGNVLLAHMSVAATKPFQLQYHGIGRWQAYTSVIRNLAQDRSPEGRAILERLRANATGQMQDLAGGYEPVDGIPGQLAAIRQFSMRLGGLPQMMARQKQGAQFEIASFLGQNLGRGFDALDPKTQRALSIYGIGTPEWEALRQSPSRDIDGSGKVYLTPAAALSADVDGLAPDRIERARDPEHLHSIRGDLRDRLAMKLAAYYADVANRSTITPGIPERAFMTQHAGRFLGPLVGQYKTWAMSAVRQMWGQAIYGSSKAEAVKSLAELVAVGTAIGYARLALTSGLQGETPEGFNGDAKHDAMLASEAMIAGGGLGIFGDYLMGQYARFSGSAQDRALEFVSNLVGPGVGDIAALYGIGSQAAGAAFSDDPTEQLQKSGAGMARFLVSHLPFVNTFYLRLLSHWLVLDRLNEMADPGYLQRRQDAVKQRTGQDFWLPPEGYAGANR